MAEASKQSKEIASILMLALLVRGAATLGVGVGFFGDGGITNEAARQLGTTDFPLLSIWLAIAGGGRALSVMAGAIIAVSAGQMALALGSTRRGAGLLAACAPLLVLAGAQASSQAIALGMAAAGAALVWAGIPLWGAFVAGASLWTGFGGAALLPLIIIGPFIGRGTYSLKDCFIRIFAGLGISLGIVASGLFGGIAPTLETLLTPLSNLSSLSIGAITGSFRDLLFMPTWTGHPAIGALALGAVVTAKEDHRFSRLLVLLVSGFVLVLSHALFSQNATGSVTHLLAPASFGLTVVAGCALARASWLSLLLIWPSIAVASQTGSYRAVEEDNSSRLSVPWIGNFDVRSFFESGSICGQVELHNIGNELINIQEEGSEVITIKLRDNRESELFVPLALERSDLELISFSLEDCGNLDVEQCASMLLERSAAGATLIAPLSSARCDSTIAAPGERLLSQELEQHLNQIDRFGVLRLD